MGPPWCKWNYKTVITILSLLISFTLYYTPVALTPVVRPTPPPTTTTPRQKPPCTALPSSPSPLHVRLFNFYQIIVLLGPSLGEMGSASKYAKYQI